MHLISLTVMLLLVAGAATEARSLRAEPHCPPPGLDSVKDFDLQAYIAAPWYAVEQVVVTYQPRNSFYCTRARYVPVDPSNLQKGVTVINYGNRDGVNNNPVGVSGAAGNRSVELFAVPAPVSGPTAASKLLVGPKQFLAAAPAAVVAQRLGAPNGNYRVVAAGPSKDKSIGYDWAIIVGGASAPSEPTASGLCGPSKAKDEGLWLFHRNPLPPQSDIDHMKQLAKSLGIDTSRLEPVVHKGCKYEGADPTSPSTPAAAAAGTGANGATGSSNVQSAGGSSSSNAQSSGPKKLLVGSAAVAAAAGGCKQHWLGWLLAHGKGC
ncbi:hypothetical protein OEZ85_003888 [Tetradesmus obliquus]|uniref:Lipocalin/cytosolic fatty-acid binding domain-containing protein n=1 Tax=Tetradesmus obliquus TaxID=3088 RepID=A0ABY8UFQ0_TETOB|nr:hypothetical protein OEZ85_003888 [Tetradesmus obliquus]